MVKQIPHEWTEETNSPDIGLIISIEKHHHRITTIAGHPPFFVPKALIIAGLAFNHTASVHSYVARFGCRSCVYLYIYHALLAMLAPLYSSRLPAAITTAAANTAASTPTNPRPLLDTPAALLLLPLAAAAASTASDSFASVPLPGSAAFKS
jgi:hypothetical protein